MRYVVRLCLYICGMKRILQPPNRASPTPPKEGLYERGIFILILPLILSGCGLFKKSVEKHAEKIELEQETIWQISEKSDRQTLTIENENAQDVLQIRADSVLYNPHSGDFRAKGNVAIISSKKQTKNTQKQDFLTTETQSQKTDFSKVEQIQKTQTKQVEKRKTPAVLKLFLLLILLVAGYLVYRKIKNKLFKRL